MNTVTNYLKNMIDAACDTDLIYEGDGVDMDDVISAENTVAKILKTTYNNADYDYLKAYAQTELARMWAEYEECSDRRWGRRK